MAQYFQAIDAKPRALLIDGDVIAFTAASAVQHTVTYRNGIVMPFAHRQEGEAVVDNMMYNLVDLLNGRKQVVLISCPTEENFRLGIFPGYKGNRKETIRPLLLPHLRQYMIDKYKAEYLPRLEADDALGILSTDLEVYPAYEKIIVGKDKDFKTVPGFYHRLKDIDAKGKAVINEISPWEAAKFHLFQTLKGDMTDGYPGCPGIGDARAKELVDNPMLLINHPRPITRGPRKGEMADRWDAEPTNDYWGMVVSHYEKGGQTEQDALVTARLANILHADQYNKETGEITLWDPQRIRDAM